MLLFPPMFGCLVRRVPAFVLGDGTAIAEYITLQLHYKKMRVI
jgi:hypothetical protein